MGGNAVDRARGALVGLAVGDAAGTAIEFLLPGSFEPINDMVGGGPFHLEPGQWTDDTSMALCLADAIVSVGRTIADAKGVEHTISLFAQGGAIGTSVLTDTGERTFLELPRVRTHRNTNKGGDRWYNEYRLTETYGGGTIMVRLRGTDEDTKRRFNRSANIRQIPQIDPDVKALYRRRNDAESINRALDDALWLRRAHSVGRERQHLNVLTHALVVNSLAIWRHAARQGDPPLPIAA